MDTTKGKRQLIIEAAVKIFARDGYHKATVSDIAEEAGIGKGTIYEYFNSKEQLFLEMIKFFIKAYLFSIKETLQQDDPTREKLKGYFEVVIDFTRQHLDLVKIFSQEMWKPEENFMQLMLETKKQIISLVEAVFVQAVEEGTFRNIDTKIATLGFLGGTNYMVLHYMCKQGADITDREIEEFIDLFLKGLEGR
ncbi:MAG: TetR/AcrR family transcriptional regulator [Clostridiaceae bacterium]|nr:TetR/AcrR family transcriptional regulator [Clostridiaceae bacterium]